MSAPSDRPRGAPRGVVVAVAAMVTVALLAATLGRGTASETAAAVRDAQVHRILQFADLADGSVAVTDAVDGTTVAVIERGEGGFVRGMMRALARVRMQQGVGPEPPYALASQADGRLVLQDPATASQIPLDAFGPSNVAAFAALLPRRSDVAYGSH